MISLGPIGLAGSNPFTDDAAVVADEARQAEDLGFATLWRSGNLPMLAAAVRATTSIPVATGIIPVVRVPSAEVIATHAELQREHPDRFLVGLGGAHGPQPVATLNAYLDELDAAGIDAERRVLAALGPKMLTLARDRAGGAYPYLVTPSYVASARSALGPDRLLAVLLMVIPVTDRELARTVAAGPLQFLAGQGGYRRNLLRQGFTETEIDTVGDRLLDGVTAWGAPELISQRVAEYHSAGADQVVVRIAGIEDTAEDAADQRARLARTLLN
ncbi:MULTISPECIES: TIGR03620 family F420-dependent LLM class oxidoreductase [unclassified Mycolicibacterium]|uniref:TIGR03620 family F420-dependent LLM class oxidoreductase n=1 Tax=unclassified Mycolicibacterium TaxID=2636767 RepID=UPI0012DDAF03|nr:MULTISPECIES: TIGR03620 family F420-dependent LLM class oxidoreductase [unclassified Mycolicibacterium]MUL85829.1 TIGR03620 family F420-dependent LLM class oxidoreductase [Mycolicibacterium sp. CBMA 329]MUL90199.1 TIGR03620 family F420-dependent LLM class oxidoreductase [Mycolicibacterium sp. CBMA 331]MUM00968.1 TIGR03620 family F420-dependent LLM class oxidoreductase [Mycolicibacterium sp. CBMA 334]MUM30285.1 TIGR03620 family F420-dependent LLM class oxidoreductase [Mycolicibacterium sp. CB